MAEGKPMETYFEGPFLVGWIRGTDDGEDGCCETAVRAGPNPGRDMLTLSSREY